MASLRLQVVAAILFATAAHHAHAAKSLYDLAAVDIDGNLVSLSKYRGTISLVINVASFCGLTKANYKELVQITNQLRSTGKFQVLAFPCNQFNSQEPKSNAEIKEFARSGYGATFPMFAKTTVNPEMCTGRAESCTADSVDCCPTNNIIYKHLKGVVPGAIQWNFEKFLVDENGLVIKRYPPTDTPLSILPDIQAALVKIGALSIVTSADDSAQNVEDSL